MRMNKNDSPLPAREIYRVIRVGDDSTALGAQRPNGAGRGAVIRVRVDSAARPRSDAVAGNPQGMS